MIDAYRLAFTDSISTAFRPRGAPGRWNSRGVVVVYASEHPALAALEMLAAWDDYQDFGSYHLYRARFNADVVEDAAPDVLNGHLAVRDREATQAHGDAWVKARRSVALRVPSVVSPASYNYLFNPDHPAFDDGVTRESLGPYAYDERLVTLLVRAKRP